MDNIKVDNNQIEEDISINEIFKSLGIFLFLLKNNLKS